MMSFDINRIANLASLSLNKEEQASFENSMDSILDFVETIARLDLGDNNPKIRSSAIPMSVREDVVDEECSISDLEKNTPKMDNSYIIVPQVIKK